ncbi:MAG TPA: type III polyketide synthase [Rhizomicrobium sp.]|jgi:predicted naringenin-chalcone synthase
MTEAYVNRIATAVPPHDVHTIFLAFGREMLAGDSRRLALFNRMADRSAIAHRYSFLEPAQDGKTVDTEGFYRRSAFPDTAARMRKFEACAPGLAVAAVEKLLQGENRESITHIVVTTCTGLSAPGIDLELIERCGLPPTAERTMVGFMGCYAAINALKLARHIVRSQPGARVLAVNLELCSLHLHETQDIEEILSFLLFADGCAAALVSADPVGVKIESFRAALVPDTRSLIRWNIRNQGFDMVLSGGVPGAIRTALSASRDDILGGANDIDLWAVHPGGRTVLDAVEQAFGLAPSALEASRGVLNDFGNMSSGTVMFVLDRIMRSARPGMRGCAMSFGPGLVAETMMFRMAA